MTRPGTPGPARLAWLTATKTRRLLVMISALFGAVASGYASAPEVNVVLNWMGWSYSRAVLEKETKGLAEALAAEQEARNPALAPGISKPTPLQLSPTTEFVFRKDFPTLTIDQVNRGARRGNLKAYVIRTTCRDKAVQHFLHKHGTVELHYHDRNGRFLGKLFLSRDSCTT